MPDQTPLSPKIEDLKARIRLDPKSRLFLPLAEELRKSGRAAEAEKVLRDGLEHHSTYLSAWISLGRCLIGKGERREAVPVLMNALSIDPGNVVAARLLADNYLALGEKVEAIKKLKLVRALLPADDSVDEAIAALEAEVGTGPAAPPRAAVAPEPPPPPPATEASLSDAGAPAAEEPEPHDEAEPHEEPRSVAEPPSATQVAAARPFFMTDEPEEEDLSAAPEDSTTENPEVSFDSEPEPPLIASAEAEPDPFALDSAEPFAEGDEALPEPMDPADEQEEAPAAAPIDEQTSTLTMADLYARQGHTEAAREIYERILERDPSNDEVRQKLELLARSPAAAAQPPAAGRAEAVLKLEKWLQKVGQR